MSEPSETETTRLVPGEPEEFSPSWSYVKVQTIGMGALSVAVLLANASQLTAVVQLGGNKDASYSAFMIFIVLSISSLAWDSFFIVSLGVAGPEDNRTSTMTISLILILFTALCNVVGGAVGISYVVENH